MYCALLLTSVDSSCTFHGSLCSECGTSYVEYIRYRKHLSFKIPNGTYSKNKLQCSRVYHYTCVLYLIGSYLFTKQTGALHTVYLDKAQNSGGKQPACEADHSPLSSVVFKNE